MHMWVSGWRLQMTPKIHPDADWFGKRRWILHDSHPIHENESLKWEVRRYLKHDLNHCFLNAEVVSWPNRQGEMADTVFKFDVTDLSLVTSKEEKHRNNNPLLYCNHITLQAKWLLPSSIYPWIALTLSSPITLAAVLLPIAPTVPLTKIPTITCKEISRNFILNNWRERMS